MFSLEEMRRAHEVVQRTLRPTPAFAWPLLAERLQAEVVVKHENHQPTGAFKVRGGLAYVDALMRREPTTRGLISATRLAQSRGLHAVPSFHRDLALGVSTYALELLGERPDLDVLYVPIGQGSGICGCIAARDALRLKTEIVGVQSTEAPAYALSFAAGHVVRTNTADTCADGMATRFPDEEALAVILKGASRVALVSDEDIAAAIRAYWTDTHNLAEGAGAAALAAGIKDRSRLQGRKVGLVLSGGNIDFDLFQRWVATAPKAVAA